LDQIIRIKDLVVTYPTERGEIRAVDRVSLTVGKGEILGLIGESGSGKSTLGGALLNHIPPPGRITQGEVTVGSTLVTSLSGEALRVFRWKKAAVVFQSAMNALDPVQTVGSQIVETMRQHMEISKREAMNRAEELLRLVKIDPSLVFAYPHELSGGMRQRVIIAMSLCLNPEIIIADEPTTGLDVVVQSGILQMLKDIRDKLGLTIILISHDISIMGAMCDRIAVMYAGKIIEVGRTSDIINRPSHPYTEALLGTILEIGRSGQAAERIPGAPPNMMSPPGGCRFHPRCRYAFEKCRELEPPLIPYSDGLVACWLREEEKKSP
jgi:peptide/nickel transport system ATP-binding protein